MKGLTVFCLAAGLLSSVCAAQGHAMKPVKAFLPDMSGQILVLP